MRVTDKLFDGTSAANAVQLATLAGVDKYDVITALIVPSGVITGGVFAWQSPTAEYGGSINYQATPFALTGNPQFFNIGPNVAVNQGVNGAMQMAQPDKLQAFVGGLGVGITSRLIILGSRTINP
jgi:hypothetical protein